MFKQELRQPLHASHPVVLLVFGLVPSLAVATTFWRGVYLGAIGFGVLVLCSGLMVFLRRLVPEKLRLLLLLIVAATAVTLIDILFSAKFPLVRSHLGIYVAIFAVNGLVLSRADTCFRRFTLREAVGNSIVFGGAFGVALAALGGLRELLGGGLFCVPHYMPIQFFISPAGGFLLAGLMLGLLLSLCRRIVK